MRVLEESNKRCPKCGCLFTFDNRDLFLGWDILNTAKKYVRCPQCKKKIFVRKLWDKLKDVRK